MQALLMGDLERVRSTDSITDEKMYITLLTEEGSIEIEVSITDKVERSVRVALDKGK